MNIVLLSGSVVGSNTKAALTYVEEILKNKAPNATITFLDLAQYDVRFSDGRHYFEYEDDTKFVAETLMAADIILIGTPVFQASIPAPLKNIFDLLPVYGLRDKVVGILATAGSQKHYLVMEQQLKPILFYMKAHIVPTYVFIEEKDILRKKIINDDTLFRLDRLVEDTFDLREANAFIKEKKEAEFDF